MFFFVVLVVVMVLLMVVVFQFYRKNLLTYCSVQVTVRLERTTLYAKMLRERSLSGTAGLQATPPAVRFSVSRQDVRGTNFVVG